jgi:hypothetical protein
MLLKNLKEYTYKYFYFDDIRTGHLRYCRLALH